MVKADAAVLHRQGGVGVLIGDARLPSEYLLNSTVRLFHQMGQIFRDNAAPPSNPMGIRIDSKRRKKLMQKRLAMGHKQDDHEQNYGQTLQ